MGKTSFVTLLFLLSKYNNYAVSVIRAKICLIKAETINIFIPCHSIKENLTNSFETKLNLSVLKECLYIVSIFNNCIKKVEITIFLIYFLLFQSKDSQFRELLI